MQSLVWRFHAGEEVAEAWRFANRKDVRLGDRVFLLLQGNLGPAIIGYGRISGAALQSDGNWQFPVRFEALVDPTRAALLPPADLRTIRGGEKSWNTQSSGVRLSDDVAAVLDRLVIGAAPAPSLQAWREDPASARATLDELLRDIAPDVRRRIERFMADSVDYVSHTHSECWGFTLEREWVRFNVGFVNNIILDARELTVLVERGSSPRNFKLTDGGYRNAPGCGLVHLELSEIPESLEGLLQSHHRAIDICARHTTSASIRGAHSPGLVAYLAAVSGKPLVDPSYYVREPSEIARALEDIAADQAIAARRDLNETEKEALRKYRCGQGVFRDRVKSVEPRCRVTLIESERLLRASHIKPWRDSNNSERLDCFNGLFLAPHIDALFDQRLISFSDDGDLLISPTLDRAVLTAWGIPETLNVGQFAPEQREYLKHHRGTDSRFPQLARRNDSGSRDA
jgi:hypothetical protein